MPVYSVDRRNVIHFGLGDLGIAFFCRASDPTIPDRIGIIETDPGTVGRLDWRRVTDGEPTPPIVEIAFENVESLDCVLACLNELREFMVQKKRSEDIHANG